MKIKLYYIVIVFTLFCLHPLVVCADTHSAADCTHEAVQDAIDAAVTGDIVTIPDGNCTWDATVTIANTKAITLQGSGAGVSNITIGTGSNSALEVGSSGSRITALTFASVTGSINPIHILGTGWRIDGCSFTNSYTDQSAVIQVYGSSTVKNPSGLIDNNILTDTKIVVYGTSTGQLSGTWNGDLGLGTSNLVYIENNTFIRNNASQHNAVDSNSGARYVARYNDFTNTYVEAHGPRSANLNARGTRGGEIYNNTFSATKTTLHPITLRGGTWIIYGNTFTGYTRNQIDVDTPRACFALDLTSPFDWGQCDGSSDVDENQTGTGWRCRDQIGSSGDSSDWTDRSSPPSQTYQPLYAWGNTAGVVPADSDCVGESAWIVEDTDYYNCSSKSDCESKAIPMSYSAYTCPHPLTGLTGSCNSSIAGTAGYNVTLTGISTAGTLSGNIK